MRLSERRKLLPIARSAHPREVVALIRRVRLLDGFIGKDVSVAAGRRVASERPCVRRNYFRSRVALTFRYRGGDLVRRAMELVSRFAVDWLALYNAYLNVRTFGSSAYLLTVDRGSSYLCLSL